MSDPAHTTRQENSAVPRSPATLTGNHEMAFLSFSLGPVQSFIAAARTVRDLWTGSYLLAWLTQEAMRPIKADAFLVPALNEAAEVGGANLKTPCLPNRFIAEVPAGDAADLAKECVRKCRQAWSDRCQQVFDRLDSEVRQKLPDLAVDWARLWKSQVSSFWEIRTTVLPWSDCTKTELDRLLHEKTNKPWTDQLELLGAVQAATKLLRPVPVYHPEADDRGRFPAKCSLLGSYEQMGPADLDASAKFWQGFAEKIEVDGTRIREGERLCAISLVKRFACPGRLHFEDTATVAAAKWLAEHPDLLDYAKQVKGSQWLHWPRSDHQEDKGESLVPREVWDRLLAVRRQKPPKPPPTYYAILMLDGDRMGERFRQADGAAGHRDISRALATFATKQVQRIVEEEHSGTLIYGGGDDVLALLPTVQALAAATELKEAFAKTLDGGEVSAGLAVVHYKEDLRFALEQARRAEKAAKDGGRNALTLTVCRRSGEHASALIPWSLAKQVETLVADFGKSVSDRWAYRLREKLPALKELPEPFEALTRCFLDRLEMQQKERDQFRDRILGLLGVYREELEKRNRANPERKFQPLESFVTLCQSASFLARGRDE